ncbi:response regulator [Hydrogenophaga sp. A37]
MALSTATAVWYREPGTGMERPRLHTGSDPIAMNKPAHSTEWMAQAYEASQAFARPSGILIVDDHDLVRLGLRALIASQTSQAGTAIQVFEVKTLAAAIEVCEANRTAIDLVFLDLELSDSTGLSGLATFKAVHPQVMVVVLSGESDGPTIKGALQLGAAAYLRKTSDLTEVIAFIRSRGLLSNAHGPSPQIAEAQPLAVPATGLSSRQTQILGLVLQGMSNREISETACLAEGTIKNHLSSILLHFGVRSRAHLISLLR